MENPEEGDTISVFCKEEYITGFYLYNENVFWWDEVRSTQEYCCIIDRHETLHYYELIYLHTCRLVLFEKNKYSFSLISQ